MSSLIRYKKSGGFLQLLTLIETFGPQKKEKFLEMIEAESKAWGAALRAKMLTIDRIFSWPDDVVSDIFRTLPYKNMAYALSAVSAEQGHKVMQFMSVSEKRRIEEVWTTNKPTADEIASTLVQVVELTRKMMKDKQIHPEKFDEGLILPEDFESKIESYHQENETNKFAAAEDKSEVGTVLNFDGAKPVAAGAAEIAALQKSLGNMAKENKSLKDEVRVLKDKLERIKKIA